MSTPSRASADSDKTISGLTGVWDGPDAQRFVQQGWPPLRKSLVAAQTSVDGLGQSALNNVAEQRHASTSDGSASQANSAVPEPAIAYLATRSPGQILSDADGLRGTRLGPFEVGSLAKELIPGAGNVTDTLDIAAKISNGQVPWSEMLGVGAGALQDTEFVRASPELYLGATAVKVWLDAADQASKADFSGQQMQTNGAFIFSHPGEAAAAAGEAIVGWVPNLLDDFGLKL
jgi:hypothetical protein